MVQFLGIHAASTGVPTGRRLEWAQPKRCAGEQATITQKKGGGKKKGERRLPYRSARSEEANEAEVVIGMDMRDQH